MARYNASCTILLHFEAESDDAAYAYIRECFDHGYIEYDDINDIELEGWEEE